MKFSTPVKQSQPEQIDARFVILWDFEFSEKRTW